MSKHPDRIEELVSISGAPGVPIILFNDNVLNLEALIDLFESDDWEERVEKVLDGLSSFFAIFFHYFMAYILIR